MTSKGSVGCHSETICYLCISILEYNLSSVHVCMKSVLDMQIFLRYDCVDDERRVERIEMVGQRV